MKSQRNAILLGMISRVKQLLEQFEESNSIQHKTTMGSLREAYLKDFLSSFVPPNFLMSSGFTTDSLGTEVSPQLDLLIYNRHSLPSFALSSFATIVPIEAVELTIEVKSRLKTKHIDQIKDVQDSFRRMWFFPTTPGRSGAIKRPCLGVPQFVVAFETDCSVETLKQWFSEEERLEVICVVGKLCILRNPNSKTPEIIHTNGHFLDVMHLVTRMYSMISVGNETENTILFNNKSGDNLFRPDYGAYLTFDVPE